MNLIRAYDLMDFSGRVHGKTAQWAKTLDAVTTQVSSLGQTHARPASLTRKWATRAAATAVAAAIPGLPIAALTFGPLAVLAFGVGRDRTAPDAAHPVRHPFGLVKAHGLLGMPEHFCVYVGKWAQTKGYASTYKVAMGLAIGLAGTAQLVRGPMAMSAMGLMATDHAAQLLVALGAACFGFALEQYRGAAPRTA